MGIKRQRACVPEGCPDKKKTRPRKQSSPDSDNETHGWRIWFLVLVLTLASLAAYQPAWHGGRLWDDDSHITRSELRSAGGLWRIWVDLSATQQYYPIAHSAFWLQDKLWGDDTLGYHLVNIFLHLISAFLVAIILQWLEVPGAWLAAAIFALHPVQVESVAWITELKNTLSGVFYLGAFLAYLRFDKDRQTRHYAWAMALFVLALLSKTVTATLPAALLVVFWWQRGRLHRRRDGLPLVPFFVLGAVGGLLTAWAERTFGRAQGAEFQFTLIERGLIAGRAIWFYLGKLFWPTDLIFIYPRWQISRDAWWQYLYPLGVIALLSGLWLLRKRSRAPLAAMLFFCGTLFPALGFINVYPFRYSFVADHFQYLASIAIIALFSAGLANLVERWHVPRKPAMAGTFALGGMLAFLTWSQSHQYADAETLYRTTISRNPSCWMAHVNLGSLMLSSSTEEAMWHFKEAIRLKPDLAEAYFDVGSVLQKTGHLEEAIVKYNEAMRLAPDLAEAHNNLGNILQKMGHQEEALPHYREAVRLKPDFVLAYNNLGLALQRMGRFEEAIANFKEALRLRPDDPDIRANLTRASSRLRKN